MYRSVLAALLMCSALSACGTDRSPGVAQPTAAGATAVQPTVVVSATRMPTAAALATAVPATAAPATSVPTRAPATPVPPTPVPPVPTAAPAQATTPMDAVKFFLSAAQADPSGAQAVAFTDAPLRTRLLGGEGIGSIIGAQNPFTAFAVDQVVSSTATETTVQATLSYGSNPQPMQQLWFAVQQNASVWRVTSIRLADAYDIDPEERAARDALAQFIGQLSSGQYASAAALYGSDYQMLQSYNPDITGDPSDGSVQVQLFDRACNVNGFLCLPQRRIVGATRADADTFIVDVELNNLDGSQYSSPANGGAPFGLRVQRIGGQWRVLDIPFSS